MAGGGFRGLAALLLLATVLPTAPKSASGFSPSSFVLHVGTSLS